MFMIFPAIIVELVQTYQNTVSYQSIFQGIRDIFNHIYTVSEPKPPTPFLPIGKKTEPGNFYV